MEMKELISPHQAQVLMIAVLIVAPVAGLVWGAAAKRLVSGFLIGLAIGIGNFILWTVYNAITDRLGLDTVKNLVVNLVLFIVIGIIVGGAIGYWGRRGDASSGDASPGGGGGGAPVPAAVGGGPKGRAASSARTREEAEEPPRNP